MVCVSTWQFLLLLSSFRLQILQSISSSTYLKTFHALKRKHNRYIVSFLQVSARLLRSEYTYVAVSGLYPYLGYDFVLWTSTYTPVKIVDTVSQHKWAQKILSPLFYHFNIFWVDVCFNWNCCASGLYTLIQFEGAACVNIRLPRWWSPESAGTCTKKTVYRLRSIFIAWNVY